MSEIQLRNLSKRWGDFLGVDDFNLTIADQEFLVLLGPSGCGKTTTMPSSEKKSSKSKGEAPAKKGGGAKKKAITERRVEFSSA